MEQNRLKELILSIRKSKHNMINKASNFAEAVQAKGTVDMDTHELASLVKDAFTKRRAKVFYAETLSGVIGESGNTEPENPVVPAPSFKSVGVYNGEYVVSTYTLGDPIQIDLSDSSVPVDPQLLLLTEEEYQKFNISVDTNSSSEAVQTIEGTITPIDIPEELVSSMGIDAGNCTKMMYIYVLGLNRDEFQLSQGEYVKVTITYDGVDYVYQI